MFEDYFRIDKKKRRFFRSAARSLNAAGTRRFTAEEIRRLFSDHPELKLNNNPANIQLAKALLAEPEDSDLHEMLALVVNSQYQEFLSSGCDAFLGNYVSGINYPPDFIPMALMPNGYPVGITVSQTPRNIILSGLTGSGKTCLLMNMLGNADGKLLRNCRVIVFVRKRELRHLATIKSITELVIVFQLEDLKLSFFEPPPGVEDIDWVNESTRFTAQTYSIYSAQRLMNDCASELVKNHPPGVYPTLEQLVEKLEQYRPRDYFREGQYKSSILTCLKDLVLCTKSVFSYSSSSFLEVLTTTPGLAVIEAPALAPLHLTLLATYMMRWLYLRRIYNV